MSKVTGSDTAAVIISAVIEEAERRERDAARERVLTVGSGLVLEMMRKIDGLDRTLILAEMGIIVAWCANAAANDPVAMDRYGREPALEHPE